jgi:integrase
MTVRRKDHKGRILKEGESYRSDGRYQYRYNLGNGKRHMIYATTLEELREKEKTVQRDLFDNITATACKVSLNQMFTLYMSGKSELKQSTRTNYKYMYKKYVHDEIGVRKVSHIKYSDVKKFYITLLDEKGFKPNSLEIINTILHPVFTLAVRDGYIRTNPTDGIMSEIKKGRRWEKPKRHALSVQEQERFIAFMAKSPIYNHWLPIFTLLLGTGCRIGEVVGLRWEDCDFENDMISINHSLVYRQQDSGKCEFHITTPKTKAGIRYVPMLSEVKKALLKHQNHMDAGGATVELDGYSGFIFISRIGYVCSPHLINRAIRRILKAHNEEEALKATKEDREPFLIRDFSAHNLRHTFCTRFCENESNLKVIQEIMGHSDITTTMNIYAEATNEKKREVFSKLEGKIKIS